MRLVKMVAAHGRGRRWLIGASVTALAVTLPSVPAAAQTLSGILAARQAATRTTAAASGATTVRPASMVAALARQRAVQSQAADIRAVVSAARAAARASVPDGIAAGGLQPTQPITDAMAAINRGDTVTAQRLLVSAAAANDPTGNATWQGAGLPVETRPTQGEDAGRVVVSVNQTESRALLTWNSFNVGTNTTLAINQKAADGTAQTGWVAVNRVANSVAPSQILGRVRADGQVVVLNRNGVIFGRDAQVNTHSLLVSTLELGNPLISRGPSQYGRATAQERITAFLSSGLLLPTTDITTSGRPLLVSAEARDEVIGSVGSLRFVDTVEGGITVDAGAAITAGSGGYVIFAAPTITNGGRLTATDGQVSLQAGRAVTVTPSTGAATSVDPKVRGLLLESYVPNLDPEQPPADRPRTPADGIIVQSGLIESRRGYLSLGTTLFGSVTHTGLLSASTSVSANGKIAITAGTVTLAGAATPGQASGIEMVPDTDGKTIPQGTADQPSGFKTSELEIGASIGRSLLPFTFSMGQNALIYAPGATVSIGREAGDGANIADVRASRIDIAAGATIDVSGLKDVALDMSRNSLALTVIKRNELRDTPNYREVVLDGSFTLNGATLYVDPRVAGVRADGVAWIGSPLVEAASIASQIGATASEFMTRGGTVTLATGVLGAEADAATAPRASIAAGARIDFSGGWVSYAPGTVRTSSLLTADGRVVDVAAADPNDNYVAVIDGFTAAQPRFGILRTFTNAVREANARFEVGYDEGRDAGALVISAPAITLEGSLFGNAFAGARQVTQGVRPSVQSSFTQDPRLLQRKMTDLPSSGFLRIGSFVGASQLALGANIYVRGATDAVPVADTSTAITSLSDAVLNAASLSALTLQTSGSISLLAGSALTLAPGGVVRIDSGRSITLAGSITAPSGRIDARTYEGITGGSYAVGSPFLLTDNLSNTYVAGAELGASPFDLTVTGRLSAAGLWVNDSTTTDPLMGGAFADGGSISLAAAPGVIVPVISDDPAQADIATNRAVDLSGNLRVRGTLDVSSGGYVNSEGVLDLSARGGDVSLLNETIYTSLAGSLESGGNELGTAQSVDITEQDKANAAVPDARSTVDFAGATLIGFGFGGGGTFSLTAPDISFGSDNRAGTTHIPLDFFQTTGFGELSVIAFKSRIVPDLFTNVQANNSAFLDTTRFEIRAGETLDLTQGVLPSILSLDQAALLRGLGTGARLLDQPLLAPVVPVSLSDRSAATLTLRGLVELDVLAGGTLTGAPGAEVTVGGLYNAGRIELRGGTIRQESLFSGALTRIFQVTDPALGGRGLAEIFGGPVDAQGRFDEFAINAAGLLSTTGQPLTNAALVSSRFNDRQIYFGGRLASGQGVFLASGSVTDLSGIALTDPRAAVRGDGTQLRTGRVLAGGTLAAAASSGFDTQGPTLFTTPTYLSPFYNVVETEITSFRTATIAKTLVAAPGATLDLSGASGIYDLRVTGPVLSPAARFIDDLQWSRGGTLSMLGGGTLAGATVRADGGAPRAEGGVLEWLNPILAASDLGGTLDRVTAATITGAGFDTLAARGGLRLDGAVSLALGKALLVTSAPALTNDPRARDAEFRITAASGTIANITAPYIRLANRTNFSPDLGPESGSGNAALRLGGATVGIDVVGAVTFDRSFASVTLASPGDVRLTGVDTSDVGNPNALRTLSGRLLAGGDLTIDARRVYATTGTGNLQRYLEPPLDPLAPAPLPPPFQIIAAGDSTITFGNSYLDPNAAAPLSAGTYLQVLAERIEQNGYLAAPLGVIEFGSTNGAFNSYEPTESLTFGAGSVTRVSGAGLTIPYGITTDGVEYYFNPTTNTPLTRLPTGAITMIGGEVSVDAGARIDGRGGGEVFAFEFQSGVGGSRDVLDRFNRDRFSSNGYDEALGFGYQFADQRQVFAAVPVAAGASGLAAYDPIYSADYGETGPVDLYGLSVGSTVTLDGVDGGAAQTYLLLPAHYALAIPGALRLVENTDRSAPVPGARETLRDGSIVLGGTFGSVNASDSLRRSFTLQGVETFRRYSQIITTSGTATIGAQYADAPVRPRLPLDAARVVLAPLNALRIAGTFDTAAATGGYGASVDIGGTSILVSADPAADAGEGGYVLTPDAIARLNANSLLIGGRRTDNLDGTTTLQVSANRLTLDAGVSLTAPEILLAVAGGQSLLQIGAGATIAAAGTLNASGQTGDYVVSRAEAPGFDSTGVGSILRVANGPERLIARTYPQAGPITSQPTALRIGAATITGNALALDSTRLIFVDPGATITTPNIAISSDDILFRDPITRADALGPTIEDRLALAEHVTLRSPQAIRFSRDREHSFRNLTIDAPALAFVSYTGEPADLVINADTFELSNSGKFIDTCVGVDAACGIGRSLTINANIIRLGANDVRTYGVTDQVTLRATRGIFVTGKGSFTTGTTDLTLATPVLADFTTVVDPADQPVRPEYSFLTTGDVAVSGTARGAAPTANLAPGARIAFGTAERAVASATFTNTTVQATAGVIDVQSAGGITLQNATLAVPGYSATFGDAVERVTVTAGGGTLNLVSLNGGIAVGGGSTLVSDTGAGDAGAINLIAARGAIGLNLAAGSDAAINPGLTGARAGSFVFDSGLSGFALGTFAARYANLFQGELAIRSGAGDLVLGAGQTLRAGKVTLTADRGAGATTGGAITIAGTIDTSGVARSAITNGARVNGGDVALWGTSGVTLAGGALIDTHTNGYADTDTRAASAGNVTIGILRPDAQIRMEAGSRIDAGARRTEAAGLLGETGGRLIADVVTDPLTLAKVTVYHYVEPDKGGVLHLRAPVIGAAGDQVAVSLGGTITGTSSRQVEGFRTYNLADLAANTDLVGVSSAFGSAYLDFTQDLASQGLPNPFVDDFMIDPSTPSMVRFIKDFRLSAQDGSSLAGFRLRPGVELTNPTGDVIAFSAWNLAAATFTQEALDQAVRDGDLVPNPILGDVYTVGLQYTVVPGREAHLLETAANFLYRVGGRAAGEAPVLTIKAGGTLNLDRSLSDGFFTFRDKSDANFINYQLGGGIRSFSPAILFACGSANECSNLLTVEQARALPPGTTEADRRANTILISLSGPPAGGTQTSPQFTNSPLAISGNGAAALGTNFDASFNPSGDPLGFAELFPLLSDGSAMHSSDIRLVGGTGPVDSANPLHVDRASGGDMLITGEYSYRLDAIKGFGVYTGPLELRLRGAPLNPENARPLTFGLDETFDLSGDLGFGLSDLTTDLFTNLNWGTFTELANDARSLALTYFAETGADVVYTGRAGFETGVTASLGDLVGFLQAFEPTYLQGIRDRRYNAPDPALLNPGRYGSPDGPQQLGNAYVKSYVRTGDGRIDVAAGRDVGVIGSLFPTYRRDNLTLALNPSVVAEQFASAAIYTAGVRASTASITARVVGTGEQRSFAIDSPYLVNGAETAGFIPSPKGFSDTAPVLAVNGGAITVEAGRDVLGRRDVWSERFLDTTLTAGRLEGTLPGATIGYRTNRWRVGAIGADTEIGTAARYFTTGIGALAGGDVSIRSGRDVSDLTIALNNGVTTAQTGFGAVDAGLGQGDLSIVAVRDLLAPRIDLASGVGTVLVGNSVAGFGVQPASLSGPVAGPVGGDSGTAFARVRLSNAFLTIKAGGEAVLGSVSALASTAGTAPRLPNNALGMFTDLAGVSVTANGAARLVGNQTIEQAGISFNGGVPGERVQILPPTFELASLTGAVTLDSSFTNVNLLFPSPVGQLTILSQQSLVDLRIGMSDREPTLVGGVFSSVAAAEDLYPPDLPIVLPTTDDNALRLQHSDAILHAGDANPVRVFTGGDLERAQLFTPKQTRISAGGDIIDLVFEGQNVGADDVTRIRADGDITATARIGTGNRTYYTGNLIYLGGPGSLIVEAGGSIGPFASSSTIDGVDYQGGIATVGNEFNPYLGATGADIDLRFGVSGGVDYTALREAYLNPANSAALEGDLFVQVADLFGNLTPDRSRPVYAPILAAWLETEAPAAFASVFGRTYGATAEDRAALVADSFGRQQALYSAFTSLGQFRQQDFLVKQLFFGELAQTATVDGPSFGQYARGYRAVDTLFPVSAGYTDNFGPRADGSAGGEAFEAADGLRGPAVRQVTGNVDLRLASVETRRGGDITIMGPGGDLIAGSVVRTTEQVARRTVPFPQLLRGRGYPTTAGIIFDAVPQGYEGILSLRGGVVRSFTDGNLLLNQSRLFTVGGGDIIAWSSNADLNAGQGPRSAGTFPPITVRFNPDAFSEVNSAGSITGAGIGAFQPTLDSPVSNVLLIAPVGTVDAGDAGVRASGRIVVLGNRIANRDGFTAQGGTNVSNAVVASPTTPANAAAAIAAQVARLADPGGERQGRTLISVEVLGPTAVNCDDPANRDDPSCRPPEPAN